MPAPGTLQQAILLLTSMLLLDIRYIALFVWQARGGKKVNSPSMEFSNQYLCSDVCGRCRLRLEHSNDVEWRENSKVTVRVTVLSIRTTV